MNALYNVKAAVCQSLGEAVTHKVFIGRNTDIADQMLRRLIKDM